MIRRLSRGVALIAAIILLLVPCRAIYGAEMSSATFELTQAEQEIAVELSGQYIEHNRSNTQRAESIEPSYVTRVELYRDKEAEAKRISNRQALVTRYRYDGDLTILTIVDLTSREVTRVDSIPHLPTPLSPEEFEMAKDMALTNPEVEAALAPYIEQLEVEPLVSRTFSEQDPLFGHRVVRLLFRVGRNYLTKPTVTVDLTAKKVIVEREGNRQ